MILNISRMWYYGSFYIRPKLSERKCLEFYRALDTVLLKYGSYHPMVTMVSRPKIFTTRKDYYLRKNIPGYPIKPDFFCVSMHLEKYNHARKLWKKFNNERIPYEVTRFLLSK